MSQEGSILWWEVMSPAKPVALTAIPQQITMIATIPIALLQPVSTLLLSIARRLQFMPIMIKLTIILALASRSAEWGNSQCKAT
jgi:hypothetical protein